VDRSDDASGVLVARGRIYVTGATLSPVPTGQLYSIDPRMPPGSVTLLSSLVNSSRMA